jgi:heterodisulfide reductase subunit A
VLVVGGGIAGIQASLDLADAGARVVLVEREATIGGIMAVLDKNFPTLDCSICIEAPKMSEVELHPNIEILSLAEVVGVEGAPGDFTVHIEQKARYVTDECTRCDLCVPVCPEMHPNEFDSGMATRKAIYTPIPQSVPGTYLINIDECLNTPPNYLPCNHCIDVCPPKSIDFLMPPFTTHTRNIGAIILAVGYDSIDPQKLKQFGYGSHPDILTALEFERLVNSAGPTGGEIIRPSDGKHPENILFVLCVGSRDQRFQRYCSRFCCMYSIKHAYQAMDHGVDGVDVLYMDVRSYGKGFDAFWKRTQEAGARYLRGRPSRIAQNGNGKINVLYEDTEQSALVNQEYDLVVLANAVTPPVGLPALAENVGVELDEDGFIQAIETHGGLVVTSRPGIYAAGCATGPKDIPDSVAEGSGAAALALSHLTQRYWPEIPDVTPMQGIEIPRIGVFVCHCGSNIAGVIDVKEVVERAKSLPDVVFAGDQMFSCAGNTQKEIEDIILKEKITRVVIAACSPKTHEAIFRGVLIRTGLNPFLMEMSNIRNMDSWVHKENKESATEKAVDMVRMAVEKARLLEPLEISHLPVTQRALVIGGGIAGMTCAAALAHQGIETHLVEKQQHLGGQLLHLNEIHPAGIMSSDLLAAKHRDVLESGVQVRCGETIENIAGIVGNYHVQLSRGEELSVGAIVMATGSTPYRPTEFGFSERPNIITNVEMEKILSEGSLEAEKITFIACVGSRHDTIGCSRYCCTSMIGQALRLRQMGKKVRVLYKEIRTYSRQAEELYEQAMRAGVQFFRYGIDEYPEEAITINNNEIEIFDHLLNRSILIPTDMTVLVVGLEPTDENISEQLKLAKSEDGFLMELHPKLGPAETASQGIYLAGSSQGAKDVRESMAQALAAAAKAGSLLSRSHIEKEPLTAQLVEDLCISCMLCVRVCPYNAIEQIGPVKEGTVRILEAACMGCGTCAAECNYDAIEMPYFTKDQILAQIDAALEEAPESKCLVFTCNWCSYAGADLAGIEKRQYPASARIIRTMCSARFELDFVARSFERGAGAVLITGCRLTDTGSDCHYNYANRLTEKRFKYWQRKFRRQGVEPDRLQLRWISAAEGKEFAEQIHIMDDVIQKFRNSKVEEGQISEPVTE